MSNSIWISTHAIERYAKRIAGADPTTLTTEDKARIRNNLLIIYQRSKPLTAQLQTELEIRKVNPNRVYNVSVFRHKSCRVTALLVCKASDKHTSEALTLVTIIKVKEQAYEGIY